MKIPDAFQQHGAGKHAAGVEHQFLKQAKLARLQFDRMLAARDGPLQAVQHQVADAQPRLFLADRRPAGQRVQSRLQFGKRKRLSQIIVGAAFKPGDPVLYGAHGRQHQDRGREARRAGRLHHRKAIQFGKHPVHDQHFEVFVGLRGTGRRGLPARSRPVDRPRAGHARCRRPFPRRLRPTARASFAPHAVAYLALMRPATIRPAIIRIASLQAELSGASQIGYSQ